ncbi:MAG: amino acid permease [Myxococcales bacterium]|nr:amino acid permease [Myxococcales bacterium]
MSAEAAQAAEPEHPNLSWREGLFLVGPDPLTSPYYASGFLLAAGVGYATPFFQIALYLLLFLLAPLYIEAVLLTLSNGGTYVMTRYALSHLGKLAIIAAALVGVIISFSYVATAIVSLLSYSDYVMSLVAGDSATAMAIGLSAIPSMGFGIWVMPKQWRRIVYTVFGASVLALVLSSIMSSQAVVMFAPLVLLYMLNNQGLKESVQVSKTIFLINLVVMGITIVFGIIYLAMNGADFSVLTSGAPVDAASVGGGEAHGLEGHVELPSFLPGLALLSAPLFLAGVGSSILGASGVESVMNIPEELENPSVDVAKIYKWMLSILLVVGGSLSLLLFLVLPPEALLGNSSYLLAALGHHAVTGVTDSSALGKFWHVVIVANAALMLIGATNTGFAGARGLWKTMARDSLLPRLFLTPNSRGSFSRIHGLMLVAIFLLALEAEWDLHKLERWYGATFALVMFSGMVAFILLRRFKADDRRIYVAPWNMTISGVRVPIGALIGAGVLAYALLSMWEVNREHIGELQTLVTLVLLMVAAVLLAYNHRTILRAAHRYYRRVVESVESTAIETQDRTIVVAVGGVRIGQLITKAIDLARMQSKVTGIPYRQIVVFHMTKSVRTEYIYKISRDSIRPDGIEGNTIRIFTELTEYAPADMTMYLAVVPNLSKAQNTLQAALDTLVEFHERHRFKGHIVMVGTYGVRQSDLDELQERLEGSTLVPVPLFGD